MWGWVGLYGRPLWFALRHWFIKARAASPYPRATIKAHPSLLPYPRPYEFCHIHYTLLWSELQYLHDTCKISVTSDTTVISDTSDANVTILIKKHIQKCHPQQKAVTLACHSECRTVILSESEESHALGYEILRFRSE